MSTDSASTQAIVDELLKHVARGDDATLARARSILAQRIAMLAPVTAGRVPAPRNITEVGGYINLLERLQEREMLSQLLASALGVAGNTPVPGFPEERPPVWMVDRANPRPSVPRVAAIPTRFQVRSDVASALDAALDAIGNAGCALPLVTAPLRLPPVGTSPDPDLLAYLGRVVDIVPDLALRDVDRDLVVVGRKSGSSGADGVWLRQVDGSASGASSVPELQLDGWVCNASACQRKKCSKARFLDVGPVLNRAGWYVSTGSVSKPTSLAAPGTWFRWTYVGGLVSGRTTLGDELRALYTTAQIGASSLRDRLDWKWDGKRFVKP